MTATGGLTRALRFPGQRADDATDLSRNWHKDYDPRLGRYVQSDPIGLMGGISTYGYVEGNPLTKVDPLGFDSVSINIVYNGPGKRGRTRTAISTPKSGYSRGALGGDALANKASSLVSEATAWSPAGDVLAANDFLNDPSLLGAVGLAAQFVCPIPAKRFSDGKEALVDMEKKDKRTGMIAEDMQAYKDLNAELPDPFPANKVRGPEAHQDRSNPASQQPHGHVGPVDHIPIIDG